MLGSIGLAEFLQVDERPIFIIDVADEDNLTSRELTLIYTNPSLKARPALLDHVQGHAEDPVLMLDIGTPFSDFKSWVLTEASDIDIVSSFPFAGVKWRSSIVRRRLKVVTGQLDPLSPPDTEGLRRPKLQMYQGLGSSTSNVAGQAEYQTPGYFDMPIHARTQTPGNIESLVTESFPEESPGTTTGSASIANGDVSTHDLLSGPISPSRERQKVFPVRNTAENMQGMNLSSDKGFFDWTRLPITPSLPTHVRFARSINWAATSLGPIEEWAADLRGMCNLIMASPHPAAMYWGKDHVAIYNEAYVLLAGGKHPSLMGSRYADAWAEIWDAIEDTFANALSSAQATMKDDDCLFIYRHGFYEETYFSWSIIPLIGDDGTVVGLYNPCFEKTRRKIAERRMLTLREIGEKIAAAREVSQFWGLLIEGLEYNEYDAPLVMVYSLQDDAANDSDNSSSASSTAATAKQCYLEGTLGIDAGHAAAPHLIDLRTGTTGFASVFRQAITTDKPIVLREDNGTLEMSMFEDVKWRGFGDPSRVVVIAPIHPTTGESTLGFLVMGTNPRRPYDEDYDLFVQLLGRQLATSVASVVLFEEEIRKGERAAKMAAQDRINLSNQLAVRTQEAIESEKKFTRMAELAPVGMYIGNATGEIIFANDAWYDMTCYPRDVPVDNNWMNYVVEDDKARTWASWRSMVEKKCPVTMEYRFKSVWRDKLGNTSPTWVLASASPEKDEDGNIRRIFGSITDISSQKFAESLQKRRMEEAVETKRQQERYIDTTSHEMRNPLSAILQSADSITGSLSEMRDHEGLTKVQIELLDNTIDSAQTITLCAQHQKRIVDDVLTLSKLDSAMLLVTPVDTQPVTVVQRALKMFEGELQTADIALEFNVDRSLKDLQLEWVRLDPHRLSQVLINLTTNAIKFTTTQEKRTICMHIAASRERPSQEDKWNLTYIPTRTHKDKDVTAAPEWGIGDTIYIHFAVQDTGRGLDDFEKKQLFQRFSQANPRTHVTYGGSGLGLFISRELVELQGGEIGVASESGKGSTFAFYVKARRSQAPSTNLDEDQFMDGRHSRKDSGKGVKPGKIRYQSAQAVLDTSLSSKTLSASVHTKSPSGSQLRILMVEDNLINQKVLAAQLRKIGCVVYVANHGGEAIEHIKESTFYHSKVKDGVVIDVVLMDLEMPVMDGQTCARKLREMQDSGEIIRHIPVIAVTANAREEQIKNTLQSGIDDVVSKPFRIPELVPKMQDVITRFVNGAKG